MTFSTEADGSARKYTGEDMLNKGMMLSNEGGLMSFKIPKGHVVEVCFWLMGSITCFPISSSNWLGGNDGKEAMECI